MTVHFVKDWETLSLDPRAHLLSIGVVALDNSGNIVSEFYHVVDQTQAQQGRHISQDTVAWWLSKTEQAARDAIWKEQVTESAFMVVRALAEWVESIAAGDEIAMWGNGPEADCVWTETFARDYGLEMPWKFWQQQSIRTLKLLHPDCADIGPFEGIKHHALDDARHEAKMLQKFLREQAGIVDATCLTSSAPEFVKVYPCPCTQIALGGVNTPYAHCLRCNGTGHDKHAPGNSGSAMHPKETPLPYKPYMELPCARCKGTGEPQKYDATNCSECDGKGTK